jgi:hypothetical protein
MSSLADNVDSFPPETRQFILELSNALIQQYGPKFMTWSGVSAMLDGYDRTRGIVLLMVSKTTCKVVPISDVRNTSVVHLDQVLDVRRVLDSIDMRIGDLYYMYKLAHPDYFV